jgi:hypothetical protein
MEEQEEVFVDFRIQYDGKSSEGVWALEHGNEEELIDVMAFFYAQSEEFRYILEGARSSGRALFIQMN